MGSSEGLGTISDRIFAIEQAAAAQQKQYLVDMAEIRELLVERRQRHSAGKTNAGGDSIGGSANNIVKNKNQTDIDQDDGQSQSWLATILATVISVVLFAVIAVCCMRKREQGRQRSFTQGTSKTTVNKAAKAAAVAAELEGGNSFEMVSVIIPKKKTSTQSLPTDDLYGPVTSKYESLFARVVPIVCELYAEVAVNPLAALSTMASPTSLKAALDAAAVHCGNMDSVLRIATEFANQFDQTTLAAAPGAALAQIYAAVMTADGTWCIVTSVMP